MRRLSACYSINACVCYLKAMYTKFELCQNALDLVVLFGLLHGNFDRFDYPLSKIHFSFLFFTDSLLNRNARE